MFKVIRSEVMGSIFKSGYLRLYVDNRFSEFLDGVFISLKLEHSKSPLQNFNSPGKDRFKLEDVDPFFGEYFIIIIMITIIDIIIIK